MKKCPRKKQKVEKNKKWSTSKPKSKLTKCSAGHAVKGTPGPQLDARNIKTDLEAFF